MTEKSGQLKIEGALHQVHEKLEVSLLMAVNLSLPATWMGERGNRQSPILQSKAPSPSPILWFYFLPWLSSIADTGLPGL